jgi:hypothetical protein
MNRRGFFALIAGIFGARKLPAAPQHHIFPTYLEWCSWRVLRAAHGIGKSYTNRLIAEDALRRGYRVMSSDSRGLRPYDLPPVG